MTTTTTITITNASTISDVIAVHGQVFGTNFQDRRYFAKREDFHLANLTACLSNKRLYAYCERHGLDMASVTLGDLASVMGEMKLAQRLAIVQSGQCDTLATARGAASLVAAWVATNEIAWEDPKPKRKRN